MKSIIIGVLGLLLLAGCSSNQPTPAMPVVSDANKTVSVVDANKSSEKKIIKVKKTKVVTNTHKPKKNVKVPPLPTPEVDVDMDSIVDQAADDIIT